MDLRQALESAAEELRRVQGLISCDEDHALIGGVIDDCDSALSQPDMLSETLAAKDAEIERLVKQVEELQTWNGLMQTLDKLYPIDIVPTLPDDHGRDTGARIVSLLRIVDELRRLIKDMSGPPWKEVIRKRIDAALKESQP